MVFSSITFLFYFLPVVLIAYALVPERARNLLLVLASLTFYIWGSGWLVGTLLVSVVVDYLLGFQAQRAADAGNARLAHRVIAASVVVNLSLLAWFKYAGWLIQGAADAGVYTGSVPDVVLPIGISFFTFQSMSYTIDVARGRCDHLRNPLDFALYVTLFPQLIAGPIVRYHEIAEQITGRVVSLDRAGEGALRFSHGLAKKVIVADAVAPIATAAFEADPNGLTMAAAWVGVIAYTIQIYFDFSGYADMAIGLGLMFGFRFPENFNRPYSALSITDFWRRWHITLSNWFRDYLYIPLGGGRGSALKVTRNLSVVFLLTGIWHGANWTFVVWGVYHGAWLLAERAMGWRHIEEDGALSSTFRRTRTLVAVMVGWVFFRAGSLSDALDYLARLVSFDTAGSDVVDAAMTTRGGIVLALACLVFLFPRRFVAGPVLADGKGRPASAFRVAVAVVALPVALLLAASGAFSPFLYFAF